VEVEAKVEAYAEGEEVTKLGLLGLLGLLGW